MKRTLKGVAIYESGFNLNSRFMSCNEVRAMTPTRVQQRSIDEEVDMTPVEPALACAAGLDWSKPGQELDTHG